MVHEKAPDGNPEGQRNVFADDNEHQERGPTPSTTGQKDVSPATFYDPSPVFVVVIMLLLQVLLAASFTVATQGRWENHPFIFHRRAPGLSNSGLDKTRASDPHGHGEASKCMSDPSCMHHEWRNSFNASVLQQNVADDDAAILGGDGQTRGSQNPHAVTIAHCMVGQLRSWALPTVHEHFRENVVRSRHLPFARHDIYFVVGTAQLVPNVSLAQAEYSLADLNIMALVQSRAPGGSSDQRERLLKCLELLQDTERAVGRRYDFVLRNRPDLLWHQPLPAEALADKMAISNNYDLVGMCPRDAVSEAWPCDVPNGPMGNQVEGYRAVWDPHLYPVSMKRVDDTVERVEMQLEWTYYYAASLAEWVASGHVTSGRALSCIMNFFAAGCNSYDRMQTETLSRIPLDDFVPTVVRPHPWTAEQTKRHSAFRIYVELRATVLANPDSAVPQRVVDMLGRLSSEYRSGTRGTYRHGGRDDTSMMEADGSFAYLDAQCAGRGEHCRASPVVSDAGQASASNSTTDVDLVRQYFLDLCTRTFEFPINARAYYYHPPAMHGGFDITAAHSGAC